MNFKTLKNKSVKMLQAEIEEYRAIYPLLQRSEIEYDEEQELFLVNIWW